MTCTRRLCCSIRGRPCTCHNINIKGNLSIRGESQNMSSQAHAVQSLYSFLIVTAKASKVNLKLSCTRMLVNIYSLINRCNKILLYILLCTMAMGEDQLSKTCLKANECQNWGGGGHIILLCRAKCTYFTKKFVVH